jgi:hypothetical protein
VLLAPDIRGPEIIKDEMASHGIILIQFYKNPSTGSEDTGGEDGDIDRMLQKYLSLPQKQAMAGALVPGCYPPGSLWMRFGGTASADWDTCPLLQMLQAWSHQQRTPRCCYCVLSDVLIYSLLTK